MTLDPTEILVEVNPDAIPADAPPASANYREADLAGVACATCAKFRMTGGRMVRSDKTGEDVFVPDGFCSQWEAMVQGGMVCDLYASDTPPLDEQGNEIWDFSDKSAVTAIEIQMSDTPTAEKKGRLVRKRILRTGSWPVTPTPMGQLPKPLTIVRDGVSNAQAGVISLSELKRNFDARAIPNVQIPLSDDDDEHKNLTRLNTGFVRALDIEEEGDTAFLVADMEFTKPDVEASVLDGTFADVSSGVPFNVRRKGKQFNAVLEHVCITNQPFIDKLGGFMLAATDAAKGANVTVMQFAVPFDPTKAESEPEPKIDLSFAQIAERLNQQLVERFPGRAYSVVDVKGTTATIYHDVSGVKWNAEFTVEGTQEEPTLTLAQSTTWEKIEENRSAATPIAMSDRTPRSSDPELSVWQRQREARLGLPTNRAGGG